MKPDALIVIDVQKGLDDPLHGRRSTPDFESNLGRLLGAWRASGSPVFHVRHCSVEDKSLLRPELPGNEFKDVAMPMPGEMVIRKSTASAFVSTTLNEALKAAGVKSLAIVGLTTDHCVSASTRSASDLGYDVVVVEDATAAHEKEAWNGKSYPAENVHIYSLVALDGEFCEVCSTDVLIARISNASKPVESSC